MDEAEVLEAAVEVVQADAYTWRWHEAMRRLYQTVGRMLDER
jgi:hypothetical protein